MLMYMRDEYLEAHALSLAWTGSMTQEIQSGALYLRLG